MRVAISNAGDVAAVEAHLRSFLDAAERNVIERIVGAYRNPQSDADSFYGMAGELSALYALRDELKSARRKAMAAQQKDLQDAQASA